jgi:hypothetical protein
VSRQRVDFDERDAEGVVDAADVGGVAAGGRFTMRTASFEPGVRVKAQTAQSRADAKAARRRERVIRGPARD